MKFLLDQDVYLLTANFLRKQGYDVATASELGLSRASDSELLKAAGEQGRIFVTRDRDFGNLVFVHHAGNGVIYLRILPSNMNEVRVELVKVLESYGEDELTKSFEDSSDVLSNLADGALEEYKAKKTEMLDTNTL